MAKNKVVEIEATRYYNRGPIEVTFTRSDDSVRVYYPRSRQLNDVEDFLNHGEATLVITLMVPGTIWLRADVEVLAGRILSEE